MKNGLRNALFSILLCSPINQLVSENENIVFLNESNLIHAIKTGNDTLIYRNRIDARLINSLYSNKTPLMIALDCLGEAMLKNEKNYNECKNGEYKNMVAPIFFTLATAGMCAYTQQVATQNQKKTNNNEDDDDDESQENNDFTAMGILLNPIAIPTTMLFGGIIWLLPDLFHNVKTLYYRLIATESLHSKQLLSQLRIVFRLINHPDINPNIKNSEGIITLDTVHKWQEKVATKRYKTILYNVEKDILEKMHSRS